MTAAGSNRIRILGCQLEIPNTKTVEARDGNLNALRETVKLAVIEQAVDLVLLLELCSIEYSRVAFDNLASLAEDLDGPSFQTWSEFAGQYNTFVAYSFPRRSAVGYHITAAVVGPDSKRVGYYDKMFLAQYGDSPEREYFQAGQDYFVFEIKEIKIGIIICADIRIPELSRILTLEYGAQVIVHLNSFSRDQTFYSWHHFAVTRAVENQVYFLSLNRGGRRYGHSIFCPPWIDETTLPVVFDQTSEQLLSFDVCQADVECTRNQIPLLEGRPISVQFSP